MVSIRETSQARVVRRLHVAASAYPPRALRYSGSAARLYRGLASGAAPAALRTVPGRVSSEGSQRRTDRPALAATVGGHWAVSGRWFTGDGRTVSGRWITGDGWAVSGRWFTGNGLTVSGRWFTGDGRTVSGRWFTGDGGMVSSRWFTGDGWGEWWAVFRVLWTEDDMIG